MASNTPSENPSLQERPASAASGWLFLFLSLGLLLSGPLLFVLGASGRMGGGGFLLGIPAVFVAILGFAGLFTLQPNEAAVIILFGAYRGTVRESGFFWGNPFAKKARISLRARNLNGEKLKVNDKRGNPIEIAAVVVWRVRDTAQAMLRRQQAEAVIAARQKIVTGAVSMVEMALHQLAEKSVVHLDEERKAAMVSNLLVVLCGESEAHPVINTGTLYN